MAIALATAARHPAAFNALYYATIATIIPVLFLAVAVQSSSYENLLQQARRVSKVRKSAEGKLEEFLPDWASWMLRAIIEAITFVAYLIIVAGIFGEISAVIALYRERASTTFGAITLTATIVLLLAAALGPFWALVKAMWDTTGPFDVRHSQRDLAQPPDLRAARTDPAWPDHADRTTSQAEETPARTDGSVPCTPPPA